ncbi:benzoate 4-monooxygenase cytochrome p450 [Xylariaceae sp. FL1651]|nr:benzoate 4-monooxygenase cytochrome p450 [Xylariaceae sp. FL1651]
MQLNIKLNIVAIPLSVAIIIVVCIIAYAAYDMYESWHRLSYIPGPPSAGISSWWLLSHTLRRRRYMALYEATQQYGALSMHLRACGDPDEIKRIYSVRSPYIRGSIYEASRFDPSSENLVSERDETNYNALRIKKPQFSGKDIDDLEHTVDSMVLKLLDLRTQVVNFAEGANRIPMDLAGKAQYFTLDVMSTIEWGETFGNLEADCDVYGYIAMLSYGMPSMMVLCLFPTLLRILQSSFARWLMPDDQEVVGFGKYVSTLLVAMVAGSDTSATAIRATMLYLIASPVAYRKLKAETKLAVQEGRVSAPVITDDEARELLYLQAVIKEGLRIFPPPPHLLSNETPREGDTVCGHKVPGGTQIAVIMWAISRNREVFGDDADTFRPERWLEAEEATLKGMNACLDFFSSPGDGSVWGKILHSWN